MIFKLFITSYIRHDNPHSSHHYGNAIDIATSKKYYYPIAYYLLSLLPQGYGMLITHDETCKHIHLYTNEEKFGIEQLKKKTTNALLQRHM